jgi:hypothetical protein
MAGGVRPPGFFAPPALWLMRYRMDFIRDNLSTIVVGALVFGVLALALFSVIRNFRRGKNACSCGCPGCGGRAEFPRHDQARR